MRKVSEDRPYMETCSRKVSQRVFDVVNGIKGEGHAGVGVALYLAMPSGELSIDPLFKAFLQENGRSPDRAAALNAFRIYVPRVTGGRSCDMCMLPVHSEHEVEGFEKNRWGIKEPPAEFASSRTEGIEQGSLDFVIVPGLGFDKMCNRLGRGKGYYDSLFDRLGQRRREKGMSPAVTIGVCFDEQIVDVVPTESHDYQLDFVVTPTATFKKGTS